MGSEIVIEVKGLEELQKTLAQYPEEWARATKTAMGQGLAVLESSIKEGALRDTSVTAGSVGSEIVAGMGSVILGKVGSNLPQAPNVLEWGRKPSDKMPPVQALEEWAGRHGMAGAGWAIAKKIQAEGWWTEPPRTISKTFRNKKDQVVRLIGEGVTRALRNLKL